MRRTSLRLFGLSLIALTAGCGDPNAGALFAEFPYATRCEMTLGCPGPVDHDVCGFNLSDPCEVGAAQAQLSCNVVESDASRVINFTAQQGGGFSIRVSGAVVARAGGSAMGTCEVRVVEGANTYEGICGSSLPSEAQPCQISGVTFTDDAGNPTVEGDIWCQHLPNRATPNLEIEVTRVGPSPEDRMTPAHFRFANCDGLTLD
jgi:hypothetical protein